MLVSIIMPAYNASEYIAESIISVIEQTYENWELLITDDCSTDETVEVVNSFVVKDRRIKFLSNMVNGGPAKARNTSLIHAKGQFIAFLDSDDLWTKVKLELQLKEMKSKSLALTYTSFRRFIDINSLGREIRVPGIVDYNRLLGETCIATSTVLLDKRIVGDIRMKDIYYDDFGLWLDILRDNYVAQGFNFDTMRYRVLPNSVSRNKIRSAKEIWKTYRKVENLSLFKSAKVFTRWIYNSLIKYRKF